MNLIQSFTRASGEAADPIARVALRLGIGPNAITTAGFAVVLGAALALAGGATRWGGALVLVGGVFDLLDGHVARLAKRSSAFGAFYDATMDRLGEAALCGGIGLYFLRGGAAPNQLTWAVMVTVAGLALGLLASYARARAEAVGVEANVGLPSAAARIVLLGLGPLVLGAGAQGRALIWLVLAYAVAGAATMLWRVVHVARTADHAGARGARKRHTLPGRAQPLHRDY